jgi:two-component system sensor histidine kinase/response regulator
VFEHRLPDNNNNNNLPTNDSPPLLKSHVLLVEDNQIVTCEVLQSVGSSVTITNDGQEVIDNWLKVTTCYSLVFMDCQMPVMDGYKATQNIRQGLVGDHNKDIIIIAMTGDQEKCIAAGMTDHISKPIIPVLLKEKVLLCITPG